MSTPINPEMVLIPSGEFLMGSHEDEEGRWPDEDPQHKVSVPSFYMGKYAVTFDEYDHFCEIAGREKPYDKGWGRGNRPVINVAWYDAVDYTDWLSVQTGQCYRLPTEAEWEYAARAGTTTAFWWGDDIDTSRANYNGDHSYYPTRNEANMTILPEGTPMNDSDRSEAENTHRRLVSIMDRWVRHLEKQRFGADDNPRDTVIKFDNLPMNPEKQRAKADDDQP